MAGADGADGAWRPPASTPPTAEPEEIPGYVELSEVGRGGDSIVYRARQVSMGRFVAVKVLGADDPGRIARFRREVEITVDLGRQHPNIVTLLDVGDTAQGRPFLVMDFVEAGTVHDRLGAHGPLPPHEVAELGYVLADALAFAHAHDVLHRDVKPQNILVLPTSWVLSDFGIARLADSEHTASVETFTYRHAAPQVLDGRAPSRSDDLWALGSTLFTLLDGRPPFASPDPDEDSALAYIRRARTEPHRRLEVPGAGPLTEVIDRCLAKSPEERWPDAAALRDALAALRADAWEPASAPGGTAAPLAPSPPEARAGSVAEPEPLALSVLAHAPLTHEPDAAPTSAGHPSEPPASAVEGGTSTQADGADGADGGGAAGGGGPADRADGVTSPGAVPAPAGGRRRTLLIALAALALLVGLGLGVVGAALRGGDDPAPSADDSAGTDVPEEPDADTIETPDIEGRADPELAILFTDLDANGFDVEMAWTDPSDGQARFVVSQTSGPDVTEVTALTNLPPGITEHVVPGALVSGGRQCYVISLYLPTGEFGVSDVRCITAPA